MSYTRMTHITSNHAGYCDTTENKTNHNIGISDGNYVEVIKGISLKDKIVTKLNR